MLSPPLNETFRSLHVELRQVAGALMKGERAITLQPTALVHEAYLRLVDQPQFSGLDRNQFLALAARVMRHVLVDHVRRRQSAKRGGTVHEVVIDPGSDWPAQQMEELVAVDQLINRLSEVDPEAARVLELRVFGGLTVEEAAGALDLKPERVRRTWTFARTWLRREMSPSA